MGRLTKEIRDAVDSCEERLSHRVGNGSYYKYYSNKSCYLLSACHLSSALHNSLILPCNFMDQVYCTLILQFRKGRYRIAHHLPWEMRCHEARAFVAECIKTHLPRRTASAPKRPAWTLAESTPKTLPTKNRKQKVACSHPVLFLCKQIILLKANGDLML